MDEQGVICRFTPFSITHPKYGDISKGHYTCTDPEILERLKEHPAFERDYRIVKKLPHRTNDRGMIMRGVVTADSKRPADLTDDELHQLSRELGNLEAKYFTQEGDLLASVKPATGERVVKRLKYLKQKLNVE